MKIRETISNDLDLNKCYPEHEPKQYSRSFSHWSDNLCNVNAVIVSSIVTRKGLYEK